MAYVARHLKEHVRRIMEELRESARTPSRPTAAEYAPHIAALIELGYTDDEINSGFGWETSKRYLRTIKREGKMDGTGMVRVEPGRVPFERLAPEYQEMLEYTPEAFIKFYNRFNYQRMPEHCEEWVRAAFEQDLLLLNVPPRHNKSTLFAVWWPIWNLVRDPDCQILIVSLTGTLATRWVGYIAGWLSYGEIPQVFGRFKPQTQDGEIPWRPSKGELMIVGRRKGAAGGGMQFSILSRGAGAQILGFEADVVVGDDITQRSKAVSETQREVERSWWLEEVMSRLQPDGKALVVGQRVHMNDIYGFLADMEYEDGPRKGDPLWNHVLRPAVRVWPQNEDYSDAEVLWPELWTYAKLMNSYARIGGKAAFYTMYQQDPAAADATLVQDGWLEACRDYDRVVGRGYAPAAGEADGYLPVVRVASLDPSPTMYNGLIVADVVPSRDRFWCAVVDVKSFKSDWRGIRDEITSVIERLRPTYFVFEKNIAQYWAKGDPFIEELRSRVRVMEHTTSAQNKFDIEAGLESLSFDFETGNIRTPYGSPESTDATRLLEKEIRMWTREGRLRDDLLMALWFIKYNYRRFTALHDLPTKLPGEGKKYNAYITRALDKKKRHESSSIKRQLALR